MLRIYITGVDKPKYEITSKGNLPKEWGTVEQQNMTSVFVLTKNPTTLKTGQLILAFNYYWQ